MLRFDEKSFEGLRVTLQHCFVFVFQPHEQRSNLLRIGFVSIGGWTLCTPLEIHTHIDTHAHIHTHHAPHIVCMHELQGSTWVLLRRQSLRELRVEDNGLKSLEHQKDEG